jgi:protein-L-isoaspartate(D-aspartate) O-methyltransferase
LRCRAAKVALSNPANSKAEIAMIDFARARRMMVDGQVRTSDVTDQRIVAAMLELPREHFLSPELAPLAYTDLDITVLADALGRPARRLLKPMLLAKLIQAAELKQGDAVLDVGCATGYSSALLAQIVGSVAALEEDDLLRQQATKAIRALGLGGVSVVAGPLAAGWSAGSPYDVIMLEGATEVEPRTLFSQLRDGGRLVCVQGRPSGGKATVYRRTGGDVSGRPVFDAAATILPGFEEKPAFVF